MVLKGGYPFWFDDVPKGMSRDQYKRLEKKKPKNKSMKVWIRENKKNMKKYTKRRENTKKKRKITRKRKVQKGGFIPCLPCLAAPAAFASAAIGGAGFMMKSSSSSSSIVSSMNGKKKTKKISNKSYKDSQGRNNQGNKIFISNNDFTYDMDIKRKGKKIYIDDTLYKKYQTIRKAQKAFDKLIRKQNLLLKDK